jgi:hypothetical protein
VSPLGFVAAVGGVSVAVSGGLLAIVPRPRSWSVRLQWWVAGIISGSVLTFGAAKLAEATDRFADSMVVGLGFFLALVVLLVGHTQARDAWAWWLGHAAVALAWILCIAAIIAVFSAMGPDF